MSADLYVFYAPATGRVLRMTSGAAPSEIEAGTAMALLPDTDPPPRPSAYHLLTWTGTALAWAAPTDLAQLVADACAPLLADLASIDQALVRPLGEVTEALALGNPPPAPALAVLQSLNAEKALLRDRQTALQACATVDEVLALLAPPEPPNP